MSRKQYQKEWSEKNQGRMYDYKVDYYRRNPERYLITLAKRRAKKQGLDFEITEEDINIPDKCPILGIKLGPVCAREKDKHFSPTLDRINNSKGYVKGNVAVISFTANRYKSNLSLEDVKRLLEYMTWAETH